MKLSRSRMKIDVWAQAILIAGALVFSFGFTNIHLGRPLFFLLLLWQIGSALHLFYTYRYIRRQHFLWTTLVLLSSLPVWLKLVGQVAYLSIIGLIVWYFLRSIWDMVLVYRQPKSFWDLS